MLNTPRRREKPFELYKKAEDNNATPLENTSVPHSVSK